MIEGSTRENRIILKCTVLVGPPNQSKILYSAVARGSVACRKLTPKSVFLWIKNSEQNIDHPGSIEFLGFPELWIRSSWMRIKNSEFSVISPNFCIRTLDADITTVTYLTTFQVNISLSDPTLTDDYLVWLFQALSDPCMILLEDIDATSIVRRRTSTISGKKRKSSIVETNPGPEEGQGISLSGLLNAVDGVAFAEGVVLVMSGLREMGLLGISTMQ